MKLVMLLVILSSSAMALENTNRIGKFSCKSSALLFPNENPSFIFSLLMETEVFSNEADLSSSEGESNITTRFAYMIRKTNEYYSIEEAQGFLKGVKSTRVPYTSRSYDSVSYKIRSNSRVIYLTIPTDFTRYRTFAMRLDIGEFDNREVPPVRLSCKNLDYPY